MKKFLSVIFVIITLFGVTTTSFTVNAATLEFAGGSGTENDPYLIETKYHLNNVRNYQSAYFKMKTDIVFSEEDFVEQGDFYNNGVGWEPIEEFTGYFNGDGYAVKGMVSKKGGIFDAINTAVVENLRIIEAKYAPVTESTSNIYIGSIANSMNNSTINNCHNETNIELNSNGRLRVGGIVGTTGNNKNNIINCTNKGNLSATCVGGIVGVGNNVTISNCKNTGEISAYATLNSGAYAGGIAGLSRGSIDNCYNTGYISLLFEDSLENYLYSHYCGGIVGDGYKTIISTCYNTANISGVVEDSSLYLGGIAGWTPDGAISKSYNIGSLKAEGTSKAHGSVDHIKVGGIIGEACSSSIINCCYNIGNVEAVSFSTDAVTVSFAGGIAGNVSDGKTKVYDCFNIGNVNAEHKIDVEKDGSALAGGIFGAVMNGGKVNNCYNMGKVTASSNLVSVKYGGVSSQGRTGTIDSCYYLDIVDIGIGDSKGNAVIGKIEDFSTSTFFKEFDFIDIWTINGPEGYPFPSLIDCPIKTCQSGGSHIYITDKAIEPTCSKTGLTEGKHCYVCGKVLIYQTVIEATGNHNYDNNCDTNCNTCGTTRNITHSYKITTTQATLTKNGSIIKRCTVCGKVDSNSTIKYAKTFSLSTTTYTYDGKVKTPSVTVKDSAGNIIPSSNYTVTYASDRKNAGTYKVTVAMKGNYTGTKTLTFKINPINISKCKVKLSATSYTYNGSVKTPSVSVKNANGTILTKGTHYTVTYASGRKNAGTYKVTVAMKGNYTGSKTLTFRINPISISKCELALSKTSYTYDGKSKIPSVIVLNHKGTKLTDSSYTVTYAKGRKNVGTYKVTVKMKGNYSGTKTLSFKINPVKTAVSKLTAGKKSIMVAITKKSTQITGYQIQYSTSKTFSKATTKTISSYKTTKYTLKSLSAKKTYYVRVRTYKTVGKIKYYSGWSTYKYVKIK